MYSISFAISNISYLHVYIYIYINVFKQKYIFICEYICINITDTRCKEKKEIKVKFC
jgi:hypothetical protein